MATTIDMPATAGALFFALFMTYGVMSLVLRPFESPLYVPEKLSKTVNRRYIQSRRLLAVIYLGFAFAGWLVVPWGITAAPDSGTLAFVCLTCLNLFFTLHAEVLVGLCHLEPFVWRKRLVWLLPTFILCGICLLFPQAVTILAYIQLFILLLLIGYYTPAFFRAYADLTFLCGSDVGGDDEVFYLPEHMPWISRLYVALLLLTVLTTVCCFVPGGWHTWLLIVLYVVYTGWFMNRVLFTYPLYSKMLKWVMG